ncbi:MAG: hypothetical protein H7X91_12795 [Burkholderiales bacterium]|nr:hypothetical protein [Burkholderiales bacterium]
MLKWIRKLSGADYRAVIDLKQTRKLIAELPAENSFKCLEELGYALESLRDSEGAELAATLETIDLIDHAAKPHYGKLSQEYHASRLHKYQENLLWTTIFQFCKQLGGAYLDCTEAFNTTERNQAGLESRLPVIATRTTAALAVQLKWGLLRYGPVDGQIWADLGKVYAFAEARAIHRTENSMYPALYGASSVCREFLKALMLAVSSTDKLLPIQLEIAERVVSHFSGWFAIELSPSPSTPYYFDLNGSAPPTRRLQDAELDGNLRFFGPGKSSRELDNLIHSVRIGQTPDELNLGPAYTQRAVIAVLRHLAQFWATKPPARKAERRNSMNRLAVLHGYERIFNTLCGRGEDGAEKDSAESWIAQNISAGGYGAVIEHIKGDWLRVGGLVGIKTETEREWGIGIIRRLSRDSQHQRHVGIEVLSRSAQPAQLFDIQAATECALDGGGGGKKDAEMPCMLLSFEPADSGEVNVLLQPGCFNAEQSYELRVREQSFLLAPEKLVEEGEEYDLGQFRLMQRLA